MLIVLLASTSGLTSGYPHAVQEITVFAEGVILFRGFVRAVVTATTLAVMFVVTAPAAGAVQGLLFPFH
ncbi:hypothetical protein [Actinophytocola sediminis]